MSNFKLHDVNMANETTFTNLECCNPSVAFFASLSALFVDYKNRLLVKPVL